MTQNRIMQRWFAPLSIFEEEEENLPITRTSGYSVYEDEKSVTIEAALPGLQPKECEIIFEKGVVTIRGHKEESEEDKSRKYFKKSSSSFSYSLSVPGNIDEHQEPCASLKDGIMKVCFHKKEQKKPAKIQIKHG